MQPVIIDYEKCNEDGICADVCPRKRDIVLTFTLAVYNSLRFITDGRA